MRSMRYTSVILGFLMSASTAIAVLDPESEYGVERAEWTLTPEAAKEVAKMVAEDRYRPHVEHTRLFVRTQLKYGLERDDYLHKWYDRPLMQDSSFQSANRRGQFINSESWLRQAALGRLCGHGFSAFTITGGRDNIIPKSVMPGGEVPVMVEVLGDCSFEGGELPRIDKSMKRIAEALEMPNAFRINGRTIITSYPMIRLDSNSMVFYRALKRELVKCYGDKVALVPYFTPFEIELRHAFGTEDLAKVKENLRAVLRDLDGFCFNLMSTMDWNRRTNPKFTIEVVAPILHSVFSEPGFENKLLGAVVMQGHENCYRWNYAKDCTGTRMFRDSLAAIEAIKPDFVNAGEWDEQNENTHHRPTVAQGFTTQRMMRYVTSRFDGKDAQVYPGDDVTVPNLVVSYRKALLAGEPIEVEVLNIPDGTYRGESFEVGMKWRNAEGSVVKEYPAKRLAADEFKAVWFVSPSVELLDEPVLMPELTVSAGGRTQKFGEGMWPISLHSNRSVEFRWVKQPLRDRTVGTSGSLKIGETAADGTVQISGEVASDEELRSVEVLDGPDTVYLYDPAKPDRDADGSVTIRIAWQGLSCNKTEMPSGTIRLVGAPSTKISTLKEKETAERAKIRNVKVFGHEIRFEKANVMQWTADLYADIPATEVESAMFEINIPPYFTGSVKASELVKKDIISFPAAGGMNLVFRRWLSARALTPPCGGKTAKFSFRMKPTSPDSVLRLQTVDAKYRVARCAVKSFYKPTGRKVGLSVFDRDEGSVTTTEVDAGRTVGVEYRFDAKPERGGIVASGAGLGLDGILCGFNPLVCGFGSAESIAGNLVQEQRIKASYRGWPDTAPKFVTDEDGQRALSFTNCNFVTLPQQIVPEYAGFMLEMEINPNEVGRKQGLFSAGPAYFNLYIENGRVCAEMFLRNRYMLPTVNPTVVVKGPEVKAGKWQKVKVMYDRRVCRVDVDGERGESVEVSGDFFYARHSAVGSLGKDGTFFNGCIRSLKARVR